MRACVCVSNFKRLAKGPVRESNTGPPAPEARIIPLDQQAYIPTTVITCVKHLYRLDELFSPSRNPRHFAPVVRLASGFNRRFDGNRVDYKVPNSLSTAY